MFFYWFSLATRIQKHKNPHSNQERGFSEIGRRLIFHIYCGSSDTLKCRRHLGSPSQVARSCSCRTVPDDGKNVFETFWSINTVLCHKIHRSQLSWDRSSRFWKIVVFHTIYIELESNRVSIERYLSGNSLQRAALGSRPLHCYASTSCNIPAIYPSGYKNRNKSLFWFFCSPAWSLPTDIRIDLLDSIFWFPIPSKIFAHRWDVSWDLPARNFPHTQKTIPLAFSDPLLRNMGCNASIQKSASWAKISPEGQVAYCSGQANSVHLHERDQTA